MPRCRLVRLRFAPLLIAAVVLGCGRQPTPILCQKLPDRPGVHNLLQVSPDIYSGSEPHGEEGFESLAKLGVKTVVSVDGARPDIEGAHRHGLRYVHVPIGYDGIDEQAGRTLARVAGEIDAGPIYVHCHHGQHRGPAAAAVVCIATQQVSGAEALKVLEAAGTGKQYPGLWKDVERYSSPAAGTALPELKEVAEVETFAAAMAKIDRNFDNLKLCRDAGWGVSPEAPDLAPMQEALILKEGLHEAGRNLAADRDARFRSWLAESESLASRLEEAIRRENREEATERLQSLDTSCKRCHEAYRN